MKLTVKNISNSEITQFFLNDPKLALLGLSDEELAVLHKTGQYLNTTNSILFGVFEDDRLITIVKYELFTTHAINFHMYVKSEYHHTDKILPISDFIRKTIKKTGMLKAILTVPSPCEHIHKFVKKFGFKEEGRITNCYQWREQVVDLVLYGLNLQEGN